MRNSVGGAGGPAAPQRLFSRPQAGYFLFACPKSGTTWMQRLLSAHPAAICSESRAFGDYYHHNPFSQPHLTLEKYLSMMGRHFAPAFPGTRPSDETFHRTLLFNVLDTFASTTLTATGKAIYGEKITPYRGTAASVIQTLHEYHPGIRFINLTRDGRDVIASGAAQWLNLRLNRASETEKPRFTRDLEERVMPTEDFDRFLDCWSDAVAAGFQARELFPHYLHLGYEDFLANPFEQARRLFGFLGIDADSGVVQSCLEAASFSKLSGGRQAGNEDPRSFFRKGVPGDWVNWFKPEHEAAFEQRAGKLLRQLGYSASGGDGRAPMPSAPVDIRHECDIDPTALPGNGHAAGSPLAQKSPAPRTLPGGEPNTILALTHDPANAMFASWLPQAEANVEYETNAGIDLVFPPHVALVVVVDTYHEPRVTLLRRAAEQGIPTLVLADGILEYRNTWEHPQLTPGAIFQPVLAHKIACLGRSQARVIESWGNPGKCEVTGSPRFDRYAGLKRRERRPDEPFRVLIMTALTPHFDAEQHALIRQSLLDLKNFFESHRNINGAAIEPVWRLTGDLDAEIGVSATTPGVTGSTLAEILQQVDAVITGPSTAMLEAMLLRLPVAALDYYNRPLYVQPAWRIAGPGHIPATLEELIDPPAHRMLFQDSTLHDALDCDPNAASRLLTLAAAMVAARQKSWLSGQPLQLPAQVIPNPDFPVRNESLPMDALFPGHTQFHQHDRSLLQVEVGHLRQYAADLEQKICAMRAELATLPQPQVIVVPAPLPEPAPAPVPIVEKNPLTSFDLIEHYSESKLVRGDAGQLSVWEVHLDGAVDKSLFLQPPAELVFQIPTGESGVLSTAVMLHPDVWEKPESGGCEFHVRIDGRAVFNLSLDPVNFPGDRRWHELQIGVPESMRGRHQVHFETRSTGEKVDFRWAMWRAPLFTWKAAGPAPGADTPVPRR